MHNNDERTVDLKVVDRFQEADCVVHYVFEASDGSELPEWEPGAHVEVEVSSGLRRHYSLCGSIRDRRRYHIGVRTDDDRRGAPTVMSEKLLVGTTVTATAIRNHFPLEPASDYIFIAGGIGITPLLPMLESLRDSDASVQFHYIGRSAKSMGFGRMLTQLCPTANVICREKAGRPNVAALLEGATGQTLVYCCGPNSLIEAVENECRSRGIRFRTERFHAPVTNNADNRPFVVERASTGRSYNIPADESIATVLENYGITCNVSCREGTCGSCETGVLDGIVDHRDVLLDDDERNANNTMMICVSRAQSDRLVLDI